MIDNQIRKKPRQWPMNELRKKILARQPLNGNFKEIDQTVGKSNQRLPSRSSQRDSWWRVTMRIDIIIEDTPNPGAYETHLHNSIEESRTRTMHYGFKSDGRRRDPQPLEPKGKDLLPGAYSFLDLAEITKRLRLNYGFRGPQRDELLRQTASAFHDKDIDIPPGAYEIQNYQTIHAPLEPVRHSSFKSKIERNVFPAKPGPAPGDYETQMTTLDLINPMLTSSFRSNTERFVTRPTNVPGPGTYGPLTTVPRSRQLDLYSLHGIYFDLDLNRSKPSSN